MFPSAADKNGDCNCYITPLVIDLTIFGDIEYENLSAGGHPMLYISKHRTVPTVM
jgi:hypothetical protein